MRPSYARALAVTTLLALALWLAGRILNDTRLWSQYLFWTPGLVVLPLGALGLLAARRAGRGTILAGWALWIAGAAVFFWPARAAPLAHSGSPWRVVHLNSGDAPLPRSIDADLALFQADPARRFDALLSSLGGNAVLIRHERFAVLSRGDVLAWGVATLGIEPGLGVDPRPSRPRLADPGAAMCLVLARPGALGPGPEIVVWLVDLPSDISLHRRRVMETAARAIALFEGPWRRRGEDGRWEKQPGAAPGFPRPDIVIGDFNTPAGSGSLSLLTRGLLPAETPLLGSWPRRLPLWAIDQAFVGPGLGVMSYRYADPGVGPHRAQHLTLTALPAAR